MKKVNLWKSKITGKTYEAPIDWLPKYEGWELVATIIKED